MAASLELRMIPLRYDILGENIDSIKDPNKPLCEQSKHVQAYELCYNKKSLPFSENYRISKFCGPEIRKISDIRLNVLGAFCREQKDNPKLMRFGKSIEETRKKEVELKARYDGWVQRNIRWYYAKGVNDLGNLDTIAMLILLAIDYFQKK